MSKNPYQSPNSSAADEAPSRRPLYAYLAAVVGGIIIFVGPFAGIAVLVMVVFPDAYLSFTSVVAVYAVGIPWAAFAAVRSFSATLRASTPPSK